MPQPALTAEDVMTWADTTYTRWQALLAQHPELLAIPCDIAGTTTVAQVLQHIVAVELRYAERLAALPATDYANIPYDSLAALDATHQRAFALFREQLADPNVNWDENVDFVTRSMGPARSTRKTILFHAMLHGLRHYAQLATLARQNGIKPGWPMDYLFMHIERVPQTA